MKKHVLLLLIITSSTLLSFVIIPHYVNGQVGNQPNKQNTILLPSNNSWISLVKTEDLQLKTKTGLDKMNTLTGFVDTHLAEINQELKNSDFTDMAKSVLIHDKQLKMIEKLGNNNTPDIVDVMNNYLEAHRLQIDEIFSDNTTINDPLYQAYKTHLEQGIKGIGDDIVNVPLQ